MRRGGPIGRERGRAKRPPPDHSCILEFDFYFARPSGAPPGGRARRGPRESPGRRAVKSSTAEASLGSGAPAGKGGVESGLSGLSVTLALGRSSRFFEQHGRQRPRPCHASYFWTSSDWYFSYRPGRWALSASALSNCSTRSSSPERMVTRILPSGRVSKLVLAFRRRMPA
jgi:hypothetical protein